MGGSVWYGAFLFLGSQGILELHIWHPAHMPCLLSGPLLVKVTVRGWPEPKAAPWGALATCPALRPSSEGCPGVQACRLNALRGLDPALIHNAAAIPRADTRGAHQGRSAISCHCQLDWKPGKDPADHPRGAASGSPPGVSPAGLEDWAGDPPTHHLTLPGNQARSSWDTSTGLGAGGSGPSPLGGAAKLSTQKGRESPSQSG